MLLESCLQLYFDDNDDNEFMANHGCDGLTGCSTRARIQVNKELCNQTFGIIKAKYVIEFIYTFVRISHGVLGLGSLGPGYIHFV